MDRIRDEQLRRNLLSRDCWQLYQPHRERVTRLLVRDGTPQRSLCVLGAGNCNDLDLRRLTSVFQRVHLADLDGPALAAGVAAQGLADAQAIVFHGDVDVTGVADRLAAWSADRPASRDEVQSCVAQVAAASPLTLDEPQDVVASVCLLSQLLDAVRFSLGESHPEFLELIFAVRLRHLRLLMELLRPGGWAVLITDFVSSDTCPELAQGDESRLPELAARLINARNFFTGLNPAVLRNLFARDAWLAEHTAEVQLTPPWRWPFPARTYAVYAIVARRRVP